MSTRVKAQNVNAVKGLLLTADGKALDYATVALLKAKDSVVVQSTLSTASGSYGFSRVNPGHYLVKATAVGFGTKFSPPINLKVVDVTVAPLILQTSSSQLETVVISSSRPLIEKQADRLIVNVAGSTLAAGNNALDILERAPGVTIDKDGNISLNGKAGVTVMINDKLTYLSADQLATLLRSTDGNTIQALEIISNPSAKYDAAGNSGIINIKLKKNGSAGTNGNLVLGTAQGHYFADNGSLSLNHKSGKLNVFTNLSHTDGKRYIKQASDRVIDSAGYKSYYSQRNTLSNPFHNNSYRLGADYETGKDNTAGIVLNGYSNSSDIFNSGKSTLNNLAQANATAQSNFSQDNRNQHNVGINLNDQFHIDTAGQLLSADIDVIKYKNNSNASFNTFYYLADSNQQQPPYYLRQQTPVNINVHTAKADYIYPAGKTLKLETGIKLSDVKTDNNLQAQTSSDNINYIYNTQLSNQFIYTEKIDAAYLNITKTLMSTTIQLGLRAEHTSSLGTLINGNTDPVNRQYLDLFPNLFINRTFNENNKISFNFNRRIDRPNYQSLNPFIYYFDPYTREVGNPFLKPQYTNNFEVAYTSHQINLGLSYSHTTDVNTETVITDTLTKISSETFTNLKSLDRYSFNINSSYTFSSWWSGNVNGYLIYNNYNAGDSFNSDQSIKGFSYSFKATQTVQLSKNDKFELNGRYQSPTIEGLYHIRPVSSVDAGISHSFWKGRANLKLSINDIFNGNKTDVIIDTEGSHFHGYQKYDTRIARLNFTYNFGSSKFKSASHQSGADEEKGRIGN
ncbi:MAG: hypothetical protein JWR38_4786 [Mucilaginibacter sp.]|nr:hypothetical protein [Mucilaginibacter sp.]